MQYKRFHRRDAERVVKLLTTVFPEKSITKESFLWRHFDSEVHKGSIGYLATQKGKVCAFACYVPFRVRNNKKESLFYSCSILATHPEWQRRGLARELTQRIESELPTHKGFFGFSNEEGVKIDKYSKTIAYAVVGQLSRLFILPFPYATKLAFTEVPIIPKTFFKRCGTDRLEIKKTQQYIDWRYTRHPKRKTQFLKITSAEKTFGYAIVDSSGKNMEVYDLLLIENTKQIRRAVLKGIADMAFTMRKRSVRMSFLDNDYWSYVMPFLAFCKRIPYYFTVKAKHATYLNHNSWKIVGGNIL